LKRSFYEDFKADRGKTAAEHRVIVRNTGVLAAVGEFLRGLLTTALYISAVALSSVGLTALLNKPIRDMLIELVQKTFFGGW
jgi:hypothetical protein